MITFAMYFGRVVFEICGQVFGTLECYFLGPWSQVDNMVKLRIVVVIFVIVFFLVECFVNDV